MQIEGRDALLSYGTATELVQELQARKLSALELTDHVIARIEKLDGKLNAVVVRDFERGRAAAKAADTALARGERKPLLGIPMVVKESFNVAGLPTTWGVPEFKDWIAPEDATMVARVKAAGALILGKTNVPFLLGDWQSHNEIYGATKNPWDLARTPGGSSGGSSAALAAGFGPLSLGSDIGGSLRTPALYCGIYAHKPTLGLVPMGGHIVPGTVLRENGLSVVGPMARSTADLSLTLDVTAGPEETREGIAYRLALPAPRHHELKAFRVLIIDDHPLLPTAKTMRTAIERLAQQLAKAGVKVARTSPLFPDLAESGRLYMRLLMTALSVRWPVDLYDEALATAKTLKPDERSLTAERARGAVSSYREWADDDAARVRLQKQWSAFFREWDLAICPAMPTPAFPNDQTTPISGRNIDIDGKNYSYFDQMVWPGVATAPGLPSTAAPIGLSETGLPLGVQIVGPYLEDRTPLMFAELMEREFGGFVPPPGYSV
jgi:amidase